MTDDDPVVVVGVGNRFPDADGPEAFADLVHAGGVAARPLPPGHSAAGIHDPRPRTPGRTAVTAAALLEDVEAFDRGLFAVPRRLARAMSPAVRVLLETTWEALEDAGIAPRSIAGTATGVFVASYAGDWLTLHSWSGDLRGVDANTGPESLHSMASGRIAHTFDLTGPALTVDSACSSSLVALHLAARSLRAGECETALVGGVTLALAPEPWVSLSQGGVLSTDGRSKTFDAAADGYGRGEGAGVVVLERLSRAREAGRRVLAMVRGSAVRQDGRTASITSPSGDSQVATVRAALDDAGVRPGEVGYVEAHGTGTPTGDPVEMASLVRVFGEDPAEGTPLAVSSVKANIGHLEAASGIAGVINAVLALNREHLPWNAALRTVNPRIDVSGTRLRLPTRPEPWPPGRRVAGVNAFGMSGTNAHVVLEAATSVEPEGPGDGDPLPAGAGVMLPLTARTLTALARLAGRYADALDGGVALADLAATAALARSPQEHRAVVFATDARGAAEELRALAAGRPGPGVLRSSGTRRPGPVGFLFPGRGPAVPGVGARLAETEPVVARALDTCTDLTAGLLPVPLRDVVLGAPGARHRAAGAADHGQPARFALQYALVELWASLGLRPDAVLGEGTGAYAAAVAVGALDLATALRAVVHRGRLAGAAATREPAVPFVSDLTGARFGAGTLADPGHRVEQLGGPARFDDGLVMLSEQGAAAFVEIGPGSTLAPVVARSPATAIPVVASLPAGNDEALGPHRAAARLHVGADAIDLPAYTRSRGGRLVRAPGYPFERERIVNAAVEASKEAIAAEPDGPGRRAPRVAPGPERRTPLAGGGALLTWEIDATAPGLAGHHRMHGRPLVPAARWVVAATAALGPVDGAAAVELLDLRIPRPLLLDGPAPRHVALEIGAPAGGTCPLTARSAEADGTWSEHADARVRRLPGLLAVPAAIASGTVAAPGEPFTGEELVAAAAARGLALDGPLRWITAGRRGGGTCEARLTRPSGEHPAADLLAGLVDAALQCVAATLGDRAVGGAVFVVAEARRVALTGVVPPNARCRVRLHGPPAPGATLVEGDAVIEDDSGATVVVVEGALLVATGTHGPTPATVGSGRSWTTTWTTTPPPGDPDRNGTGTGTDMRPLVVLGAADDPLARAVAQRLADAGRSPLPSPGPVPQDHDVLDLRTTVDAGDEGHADAAGVEDVVAALTATTTSLVDTARTGRRAWVVTRGAAHVDGRDRPVALAAAVAGLVRSFSSEHPAALGGHLDLPRPGGDPEAEARVVARWVLDRSRPRSLALRDGVLLRPTLTPRAEAHDGGWRAAGTVIVTGGLGGLGRRLVRSLLARGARRVLVVGRSPHDDTIGSALAELAPPGCVDYLARDLTAPGAAADVVATATSGPGGLRGLVHAAGVLDDGLVGDLDAHRFRRVLAPKLGAARALLAALGTRRLDFVVLCSSLSAVVGAPGQGNYAAANAALEALATARRADGRHCLALAWGPVAEVGMAADTDRARDSWRRRTEAAGVRMLPVDDAVAALGAGLGHDRTTLLTADLDRDSLAAALPGSLAADLLALPGSPAPSPTARVTAVTPAGPGRDTAVRAHLVALLTDHLPVDADAITGDTVISSLGVDSLMGIDFRNRVEEGLGVALPLAAVIGGATVDELVREVGARLAEVGSSVPDPFR